MRGEIQPPFQVCGDRHIKNSCKLILYKTLPIVHDLLSAFKMFSIKRNMVEEPLETVEIEINQVQKNAKNKN